MAAISLFLDTAALQCFFLAGNCTVSFHAERLPHLTILASTPNLNCELPLAICFICCRSSLALAALPEVPAPSLEGRCFEEDEEEAECLDFLFSTVGRAMALRLKASRSRNRAESI